MNSDSNRPRVVRLAPDQRKFAPCGICLRQTRIVYADLDTGLSTGRCCAHSLHLVDMFIQQCGPRFGWDRLSTWHHPDLPDRVQFGINFRSNKPFHG